MKLKGMVVCLNKSCENFNQKYPVEITTKSTTKDSFIINCDKCGKPTTGWVTK